MGTWGVCVMGRFSLKRAPFGLSPSSVDFSVSGERSSSEIQTVFFFFGVKLGILEGEKNYCKNLWFTP